MRFCRMRGRCGGGWVPAAGPQTCCSRIARNTCCSRTISMRVRCGPSSADRGTMEKRCCTMPVPKEVTGGGGPSVSAGDHEWRRPDIWLSASFGRTRVRQRGDIEWRRGVSTFSSVSCSPGRESRGVTIRDAGGDSRRSANAPSAKTASLVREASTSAAMGTRSWMDSEGRLCALR